jgi:hypothetical protein
MDAGETPWKQYDIGSLGSYLCAHSRMIARSRSSSYGEFIADMEPVAHLHRIP